MAAKGRRLPMRHLRLSQSSLEFLMTYGWAILVVIISVAGLAYFGVLSPDRFLPSKCIIESSGIVCIDYNIESSRAVLVLQNNFGEDITISGVDVVRENNGLCSSTESILLQNNQKAIFTILGCDNGNIGDKFNGEINITYIGESSLSHKIKGMILSKITAITDTTSSGICQNAENDGLCEALDIVFGINYEAACCSEHGLCC